MSKLKYKFSNALGGVYQYYNDEYWLRTYTVEDDGFSVVLKDGIITHIVIEDVDATLRGWNHLLWWFTEELKDYGVTSEFDPRKYINILRIWIKKIEEDRCS